MTDTFCWKASEKGAEVEFDCAHGQMTQRTTLDRHGDFDVAGTFTPEHGGPVRRDVKLNFRVFCNQHMLERAKRSSS